MARAGHWSADGPWSGSEAKAPGRRLQDRLQALGGRAEGHSLPQSQPCPSGRGPPRAPQPRTPTQGGPSCVSPPPAPGAARPGLWAQPRYVLQPSAGQCQVSRLCVPLGGRLCWPCALSLCLCPFWPEHTGVHMSYVLGLPMGSVYGVRGEDYGEGSLCIQDVCIQGPVYFFFWT